MKIIYLLFICCKFLYASEENKDLQLTESIRLYNLVGQAVDAQRSCFMRFEFALQELKKNFEAIQKSLYEKIFKDDEVFQHITERIHIIKTSLEYQCAQVNAKNSHEQLIKDLLAQNLDAGAIDALNRKDPYKRIDEEFGLDALYKELYQTKVRLNKAWHLIKPGVQITIHTEIDPQIAEITKTLAAVTQTYEHKKEALIKQREEALAVYQQKIDLYSQDLDSFLETKQ